jgi:hypothetical protein
MSQEAGRGSENHSDSTPYSFGGSWTPSAVELERRIARKARARKNSLVAAASSVLVLGTLATIIVTSPGWKNLSDTFFKWAYGFEVLPKIILGFGAYASWLAGTVAGAWAGGGALDAWPAVGAGLDFMLPALFLALLLSILNARQVPAILIAAAATVLGTWYGSATLGLFAGMISGAVAGLFGPKGANHAG